MLKFAPGLPIAALVLLLGCTPVEPAPSSTVSPSSSTPISSPAEADPLADTLIIPGERVGPITRNTSYQDLVEQFGAERLQDEAVDVGEGTTAPGTQVNLGPDRSFQVIWADENRAQPLEVRNLGAAWKTPEGIGMGTSLVELETHLGEFQLYGFGWDYGGTLSWEGTQLEKYDGLLLLRLSPEAATAETFPDRYKTVLGDGLFPSSHAAMKALNPNVKETIVWLEPLTP